MAAWLRRRSQTDAASVPAILTKKWRNHEHAIALHYFVDNFCRKHLTLGTTPVIAAGITDKVWIIGDLVGLLVERENQNACHGRINRADRT